MVFWKLPPARYITHKAAMLCWEQENKRFNALPPAPRWPPAPTSRAPPSRRITTCAARARPEPPRADPWLSGCAHPAAGLLHQGPELLFFAWGTHEDQGSVKLGEENVQWKRQKGEKKFIRPANSTAGPRRARTLLGIQRCAAPSSSGRAKASLGDARTPAGTKPGTCPAPEQAAGTATEIALHTH